MHPPIRSSAFNGDQACHASPAQSSAPPHPLSTRATELARLGA
jgi:hypothetical protein